MNPATFLTELKRRKAWRFRIAECGSQPLGLSTALVRNWSSFFLNRIIRICKCRLPISDFEARRLLRQSARHRRVALGSPPQSLGEDAQAECQETPRKPRKRLRLTRFFSPLEVGLDSGGGLAPYPADASGGGAIRQSSVDAADVDRSGRRDVLEHAEASAPLPLDRLAADS